MTTITTLPAGALRMSLADVARAAKVQRPVVSMWRSRHASGQLPFPEPLAGEGEQLWDAGAGATWFRRWKDEVGRVPGNNESVVEDLPRYSRIDSSALGGALPGPKRTHTNDSRNGPTGNERCSQHVMSRSHGGLFAATTGSRRGDLTAPTRDQRVGVLSRGRTRCPRGLPSR